MKPATTTTTARPPLLAVFVIGCMKSLFIYILPSLESIDEVASRRETFVSNKSFLIPLISIPADVVGMYSRFVFSFLILVTTMIDFLSEGWLEEVTPLPSSKLIPRTIKMNRFKTQIFFTVWSWNLLGISFFLNGILSYYYKMEIDDQKISKISIRWISRLALITFEIAAPCALLTSFVVTYVMWPRLYKMGGSERTQSFKRPSTLMKHNFNVIMVLIEVSGLLGGGISIHLSHIALAPLFGICYVLFSWCMANYWDPSKGPLFFYFFLDTTLGYLTSLALVVLLIILLVFYAMFYVIATYLDGKIDDDSGTSMLFLQNLFVVIVLSFIFCKFRD